MEDPKIGQIVQLNLPQILEHCAQDDPDEVIKLSDKEYCSEVFKLGFAFFRTPAEIELVGGHKRYWKEVHHVLGHEVRVTSQWFRKRNLGPFLRYLLDKGLTPVGISPALVDAEINLVTAPKAAAKTASGGSKFKLHAIGNAQNSIVRNVLGKLGAESFTEKDWIAVKRTFGHRCVYCSSKRQLVMDHAVPISIVALGEHRLGNLVPACHDCNSAKGKKRYDVYLRGQRDRADAAARIVAIEEHMARHDYEPLTELLTPSDVEQVRELLSGMRAQVAEVAKSTAEKIHGFLPRPTDL